MGRAWGTNLMIPNPSLLVAGSDIPLTAGVKTTVLDSGASPLIAAAAGGGFYLLAHLVLEILCGASPPSSMTVTLDLVTAGAAQDTYIAAPAAFTALATVIIAVTLYVPTSATIWFPTGDEVKISVLAGGQPVTVKATGSRCILALQQGV